MTVPSQTNKDQQAGNGVSTVFTVPFRILNQTHIEVLATIAGVTTTLVLTADYAVSGVGNPNTTVTFVAAPSAGTAITFLRNVPLTQETDYVPNDPFPAQSHENALDKLTMIVQQQQERIDASLSLAPETPPGVSATLPPPSATTLIGWDATAQSLRNYAPGDIGTALAFSNFIADKYTAAPAQTLFTLSADPGALANLDVSIDGVTQIPGTDYSYLATALTFVSPMVGGEKVLARYGTTLPTGITSSTAVQFQPAGAGAVIRTTQDKLREFISVLDFFTEAERAQVYAGTLADFSTSIQKAIDYAETFAGTGGACVRFPAGRYGYSVLTVKANSVVLKCDGEVYLIKMTNSGNGLTVGGQVSRVYGVELRGLQLGSSVAGVSGNLVSFVNVGQCGVYDVTQTSAFGVPWIGLRVTNASQFIFSNNQFQDCGADGVVFEDAVDLYTDNSRSDSHDGSGFVLNKVAGWYASACTAYDNGVHGFSAMNTYAAPVLTVQNQYWFPTSCVGDTSGDHNWNITQLSQSRFVGCWGATHRVATVDLHGFALGNCIDVELVGCTATNNNGSGVFILSTCSHIRVTGGGFHGNGVVAGSTHKVGLYADNANLYISGGSYTDDLRAAIALPRVQTHGIRLTGTAPGVTITGADLRGNLTGPADVPTTANGLRMLNCEDGSSGSYASAVSVTISPCDSYINLTGAAGVFDIVPKWKGRRLTVSFSSTASLQDVGGGGAFRLPTPSVTPGANGTASMVFSGVNWLLESFSVNDGV